MTSDCLPLQVLNVRLVDLASVFKTNHPPEESAALAQLTASLSGADACLFLTCTSGSGMLPSGASQFVALLKALTARRMISRSVKGSRKRQNRYWGRPYPYVRDEKR
jgi:hypothetical protein